ncbi:hypothetical protein DMN91_000772 [Ooceraea biroi]|uniref:ZAD domain-containing protein n=1 Tax=Ooceraea biroi TaxID=2015173 RepID=A0A3L8E3E5_OOCBI|nr:uncharacterized protein LOC105283445 [Ooceraea biroi]RLU26973.1 hypothetical protein DMN91_000772 [Ooceraea biroi]
MYVVPSRAAQEARVCGACTYETRESELGELEGDMETLESSRVCRLCGQHSGIAINIFDESENHVRKINAVLPIMVHEMDLLPKQMCHRCSYKLEEFHKFYVDCLKTDAALKSQLSWMRKGHVREKIGVPMVHIENVKIKAEPLDYDVYELEPLVENIDYINSMSSMAFPANGIHDGLTYATFSRCRCCCDKQNQSRPRRMTTAKLRQDYERPVSKDDGTVANGSRKSIFKDITKNTTRLRPVKRSVFPQVLFPDCPQNHLPHVDAVGDTQSCLTSTSLDIKDDVSLAGTRNHSYDKLNELPEDRATSASTIVRNLRPRKNLVNYALSRKRTLGVVAQQPSTENKLNSFDPKAATNFELTRQIKVEQTDEFEGRSRLRPRKNVDYQEPKKRKGSEYRVKRRKIDDVEQPSSRLHPRNADILNNIAELKIKQEVLDNLEDTVLVETTGARTRLQNKFASIGNLQAKIETPETDDNACLRRDMMRYFKSERPRSREKFLLAKKKSLSNILKNKLARTKKTNQFAAENYSPKCLRSQDTYLRNGKTRRNDYVEWSVKRLQTRKLIDAVNKRTKEVPAMLKLAESIKYYCEACNVSFMTKELYRLHKCYYEFL